VQQCGIGTLGQALTAGCPILAVPFAHDQPDNAYRIERLGVARVVYPPQYRSQRVAQELCRLLEQTEYRRAASEVAAKVRAEDGAAAACNAIEQYLHVHPTKPQVQADEPTPKVSQGAARDLTRLDSPEPPQCACQDHCC
jgi:UDP:flavonoid glycosyltransferase YjiC (YdhE family)